MKVPWQVTTIEALSHHLRHFSLEMTRHYITQDPEAAALWMDVEWGYTGHVARKIAAGERAVAGSTGERIKRTAHRLIDVFRRKLQIASPERVGASLAAVIQRRGLVLRPKPWVTCCCPNTVDAAAAAACRRGSSGGPDQIGPNFAAAGPSVCSSCPHAMMDSQRKPFLDLEIGHLEAVSRSKLREGTMFGELEKARQIELLTIKATRIDKATPLKNPASDVEPGK